MVLNWIQSKVLEWVQNDYDLRKSPHQLRLNNGKTVHFYEPSWGLVTDVEKQATIGDDVLNDAAFMQGMEYHLTTLSVDEYRALNVEDGIRLREKTREILKSYDIIVESTPKQRNTVNAQTAQTAEAEGEYDEAADLSEAEIQELKKQKSKADKVIDELSKNNDNGGDNQTGEV